MSTILLPDGASTAKTLQQLQKEEKDHFLNEFQVNWNEMVQWQRDGINRVWDNPKGLTPQQVVDAMGTSAEAIFEEHYQFTLYLLTRAADLGIKVNVLWPKFVTVANGDGTMTVTQTVYVPPT